MGLWKDILKESSWISGNWKYIIGNGARVKFWLDLWCCNTTHTLSFPALFKVVANKEDTVVEVWDHYVGNGSWKFNFLRAFNDQIVNILYTLQKVKDNIEPNKIS